MKGRKVRSVSRRTQDEPDQIPCRTPTPGKKGVRIERRKYDAIRGAILAALDEAADGVDFCLLPEEVEARLSPADRTALGSVPWYTTVVKLNMEVDGEIERVPGAKHQRLRRP